MSCNTCPFAYTDESEQIQNYGCLPSSYEIVKMKQETNQNWECHSVEGRKCAGLKEHIEHVRKNNYDLLYPGVAELDTLEGGLIKYAIWNTLGEEEAIKQAREEDLK